MSSETDREGFDRDIRRHFEPSQSPSKARPPRWLIRYRLWLLLLLPVLATGMHSIGWGGSGTTKIAPSEHRKNLRSHRLPDELRCNSAGELFRESRDNAQAMDEAIERGGRPGEDSLRYVRALRDLLDEILEKDR